MIDDGAHQQRDNRERSFMQSCRIPDAFRSVTRFRGSQLRLA